MSTEIRGGWVHGSLKGPGGRSYKVERFPRTDQSQVPLIGTPNLVLHTTEAPDLGSRYKTWPYPPHFGVGDGRIVQLFSIDMQSKATKYNDEHALQIEITGYSKLTTWLPERHALDPLIALVAFLHDRNVIRTGLERPADWPVELDRGPQATSAYYRRHAGLWPSKAGVYMHVEMPGDNHWNAGSFDFPRFFDEVREVLGPREDDDEMFSEWESGLTAREAGEPIRRSWPKQKKEGWRFLNRLYRHIAAGDASEIQPMDETEVEGDGH